MTHFDEYKKELDKQFGFDFFGSLYKTDKKFATDHKDMNEATIEGFIRHTSGDFYIDYLKEDKMRYQVWMNMVLSTYHFYKYHKKRFELTPDITNLLLQTDMKDVHVSFVKLPFPSIYLNVPKGMFVGEMNGKPYEVDGIYIHHYNLKPYSRNQLNQMLGKDIVSYLQLGIVMKEGSETKYGTVHLKFKKGNVLEQLKDNYERAELQFSDLATDVFALVLNTLFYIQSIDADVEWIEEAKPILVLQKPQTIQKNSYYKVGGKITIGPQLKKQLHRYEKSSMKAEREYSWLVRGHWRNQPIGKGKKERKLIWIEPYIKGNKEGQLISKDYEITE